MALELPFSKKLAEEAASGATSELRAILKRTSNQLSVTQALVNNNQERLQKALTPEQASMLFGAVSNTQVAEIKENILKGNKVSKKQAALFVSSMEDIASIMDEVGIKLQTTVGDSLGTFKTLLGQEGQDRKELLRSVNDFIEANKLEGDSAEQLINLQKNEALLAETTNESLMLLIDEVINGNDSNEPIMATLAELNEKAGLDLLNSDKLADNLDKKSSTGESFKTDFLKGGLGDAVGGGLLSFGLQQVGLGGFEEVVGPAIAGLGTGFVKVLSKVLPVEKIKSILKPIIDFFGKRGIGKFGKIFGKGLLKKLPILGAIYSFFDGFLNSSEISGISKEDLQIGDKIKSAISGLLSGLTLGLIESETWFPMVSKIFDTMSGFFTDMSEFFTRVFAESPTIDLTSFEAGAKQVFQFLKDLHGVINFGFKEMFSVLFEGDGFMANVKEISKGIGITLKESVGGMFDSIFGVAASVLNNTKQFKDFVLKNIFDSLNSVFDFFFGNEGVFSMNTFKQVAKFLLKGVPFGDNIISGLGFDKESPEKPKEKMKFEDFSKTLMPVPEALPASALEKSVRADQQAKADRQKAAMAQPPTIVVPPSGGGGTQSAPATSVDDLKLGTMQLNLAE